MAQFVSLYPCNNPQQKSDIFPQSIFSTKSENHLKKSNWNIAYRTFRPHTVQWLNSYPWTNISVVCTFIDWVAFCHDIQKANICYREKKHRAKCWTYAVNRESIQNMGDVISVIGIFWLQRAFNKRSFIQYCLPATFECLHWCYMCQQINLEKILCFPLRHEEMLCSGQWSVTH